jgi:OOP family OmpA-OmpF porin
MSLRRVATLTAGLSLTLAAAIALSGCKASASFQAGSEDPETPKEEPPPPPPPPKKAKKDKKEEPKAEEASEEPKEEVKAEEKKDDSAITTKGNTIKLPGNIVFETGKGSLKADAGNEEILDQLKAYLDKNEKVTLMRVEGHTDNVGKPPDNLKLSGERALTIKKYLVGKGIAEKRIIAVGFGESKPVADNATDEGKAQNRRTEFKIAEVNGKPYLGMDPKAGGTEFK